MSVCYYFLNLLRDYNFSELELTFTFAICCRPSVCLSSVTLVHRTQPVEIFGNVSGHPLTSTENFTEIVPGEPLRRREGWVVNARGVAKYSDLGPIEGYISKTVQDTR